MSGAGYRRLDSRVVYENAWLRFEAHEIVHPNGAAGVHGVVVTPPASAVVVLDGEDVVLVRQPRFAADASVLEAIKGGRAKGEDALACAQRETREEAGVEAEQWDALGTVFEIPSIVMHPVSLFLARVLRPAHAAAESVEQIAIVRMPLAEALEACADGRIDDAVTAVALLRAQRLLTTETRP